MYGDLFFTLLPLIPASMLVLFFFVAVNVLYRALSVPAGFDKDNDGHCGACGYVLGSLSDQRCPECGVDLLKAGLLTRRMLIQLRGSSAGALAAWTVLFFAFGGTSLAIWGGVIQTNQMMSNATFMGGASTYSQVVSYGPETGWDAETREIIGEDFTARIEIMIDSGSQQLMGEVLLVFEVPNKPEYTIAIYEDSSWELRNSNEKRVDSGDQFTAEVIDQLFALGGFDPDDGVYRSYSGQLFVLTDSAVSDGVSGVQSSGVMRLAKAQEGNEQGYNLTSYGWTTNYGTGTTTTTFTGLPTMPFSVWSPVLYTFLVLLVVYIVGVVLILRRRRNILRLGHYTHSTSLE